jgi:hypothetical protein
MPLIQRGNLRTSRRTDSGNNASGEDGETKLCCYSLNAIKRRRSLPLFAGKRLFWDSGDVISKNVVPIDKTVSLPIVTRAFNLGKVIQTLSVILREP